MSDCKAQSCPKLRHGQARPLCRQQTYLPLRLSLLQTPPWLKLVREFHTTSPVNGFLRKGRRNLARRHFGHNNNFHAWKSDHFVRLWAETYHIKRQKWGSWAWAQESRRSRFATPRSTLLWSTIRDPVMRSRVGDPTRHDKCSPSVLFQNSDLGTCISSPCPFIDFFLRILFSSHCCNCTFHHAAY